MHVYILDDGRVLAKDNSGVSKPHPPKSKESLQESQLPSISRPLEVASQLLIEEPQYSDSATKCYRTKVLQKLQEIVENQQDILAMQRQLLAAVAVTVTEEDGEFLENGPCQTVDELQILARELESKEKSAKMKNYLRSLGGPNPGATLRQKYYIRLHQMKSWVPTACKRKKGKLPFQHLKICNLIIRAMQKSYKSLKASEIEDLISTVLKFAPHRHLKC
ncbi:hypothetical protein UPYG_G00110440 [Umbra pygmaea]|uniref:Uncharacterized protein n=1 Tax=Umbra pygmaea TaxID=75934 RepID=A0ABD0XQC0_UMBPY